MGESKAGASLGLDKKAKWRDAYLFHTEGYRIANKEPSQHVKVVFEEQDTSEGFCGALMQGACPGGLQRQVSLTFHTFVISDAKRQKTDLRLGSLTKDMTTCRDSVRNFSVQTILGGSFQSLSL